MSRSLFCTELRLGINCGMSPGRRLLVPVLLVFVMLGAACGGDNGDRNAHAEAQLRVVTSLELFADMVREVGGDRVDVEALLPSGADPHTFELSPASVADVARGDIVFVNGLGLEGNVLDIVEQNAGGMIVVLTDGLETINDNPHLWLDVRRGSRYVETIRDALIEEDNGGRDDYEANASAYLAKLDRLDREMEAAIGAIPIASRQLVTFHDAFPYLAARYGMTIVGVVVPSPGQEPSARDIAELSQTLQNGGVKAAFKEPQFSSEVLKQAANDAGVQLFDLLSDAYEDGVGSYVELMRFNLAQLQAGLGDG